MNIPPDPQRGEDILAWARALGRAVRAMFPREGPDIYPNVRGTGTTYTLRQRNNGSAAVDQPGPFDVTPCAPPSGQTADAGPWVQVCLNSWLLKSPKPTDKITVTGLVAPLQLTTDAKQHVWCAVDLSPLNADTPGPITASIESGTNWNPEGLSIYPDIVVYNTATGKAPGPGDPPNSFQITLIIPLAYTVDPANDPFNTAKQFGAVLIAADPTNSVTGVTLMQQCRSNKILFQGCYLNQPTTWLAFNWDAAMPDDSGS